MIYKTWAIGAAAALSVLVSGCSTTASTTSAPTAEQGAGFGPMTAESKRDLADNYRATLARVYESTPGSRELVAKAAGVLVFPKVISAGLVIGGEYGNGELREHDRFVGYYRITAGSFGFQIGAQSKAVVVLFMTQDALKKFRDSKGWSAGADASVAVVKVGANGAVDVAASGAPTVVFAMTNGGLMANLTIQGSKISAIE